jgi:hypothetical protein
MGKGRFLGARLSVRTFVSAKINYPPLQSQGLFEVSFKLASYGRPARTKERLQVVLGWFWPSAGGKAPLASRP